jgi:AraC family transcriptional regulator of adaptative response/methylated-DNA-[protein]-cysteine methyltransferase
MTQAPYPESMTDNDRWEAVVARDRRAGFLFAVNTTGVYCRPSCPARRPKREHVQFFESPADARQAGFRACLRCRPDKRPVVRRGRDAQLAGRLERFKQAVRAGSTVTDALYEAGYGSSSRLYEKAAERLGMTPGEYRRGGAGVSMEFATAEWALGRLLAAWTERGVCAVQFGDSDEALEESLRREYPRAEIRPGNDDLARRIASAMDRYDGPLDAGGTDFQVAVWKLLRRIPRGETRTYSDLARELGSGARAIARACASNRLAGVVPCHRVIREDGNLGGYRWGIERKQRLLEMEGAAAKKTLALTK